MRGERSALLPFERSKFFEEVFLAFVQFGGDFDDDLDVLVPLAESV
jgi:hypothetical protein